MSNLDPQHPSECITSYNHVADHYLVNLQTPLCGRCGKFIQPSPTGYWWVSEYTINEEPYG